MHVLMVIFGGKHRVGRGRVSLMVHLLIMLLLRDLNGRRCFRAYLRHDPVVLQDHNLTPFADELALLVF